MIYGIAFGMLGSREDAEELVQEVFFKIIKGIKKFRGQSKIKTWIYRITINEALNWRKKSGGKETTAIDQIPEGELKSNFDNPEKAVNKNEQRHLIWQEIQNLPEDARAILILREVEGLSYEDIASLLKISKGTVSSRLFYARKKLKERLVKRLSWQ